MVRISQGQVFDDTNSGGAFQPETRAAVPGPLPPTDYTIYAAGTGANQDRLVIDTDRPLYVYLIGSDVPTDDHVLYGLGDQQPSDANMWRARGFRMVLDRPGKWHIINRSATDVQVLLVDAAEVAFGTHFSEGGLVKPVTKTVHTVPNIFNGATNGNVLVFQRNPRRRALWFQNAGTMLGGLGSPVAVSFDASNTSLTSIFDGTAGSEPATFVLGNVNAPDIMRLGGDEITYGQVRASSISTGGTFPEAKLIAWEWE